MDRPTRGGTARILSNRAGVAALWVTALSTTGALVAARYRMESRSSPSTSCATSFQLANGSQQAARPMTCLDTVAWPMSSPLLLAEVAGESFSA